MPNITSKKSTYWPDFGLFVYVWVLPEEFPPMPFTVRNGILSLRFTPTDNLCYIRVGEYRAWAKLKSTYYSGRSPIGRGSESYTSFWRVSSAWVISSTFCRFLSRLLPVISPTCGGLASCSPGGTDSGTSTV